MTVVSSRPTVRYGVGRKRSDEALEATERVTLAQRLGWSLAAITTVYWALEAWTGSAVHRAFNLIACAAVLAGLACLVANWIVERPSSRGRLEATIVALWVVGYGAYCVLHIMRVPGYGTDALAFNQGAAESLLRGVNPYTASLGGWLDAFLVPDQYHTWLLGGGEVDKLSYPALSFLVYVPALLLGAGMQTATVVNMVAWVATVLLLWRLLPTRMRWVAPLAGAVANYVHFSTGGVTDMVFIPFLVLAVWRWDRFADPAEKGPARWMGPIALGLATCVKQTPWFALPFLLVGLALEARSRRLRAWWRLPARYLATVAAVFAIVNAAFFAWSPGAFLHGIFIPFIEPTVPAGQGLVTVALFQGAGGSLAGFTLAGVVAFLLLLLVFGIWYSRCKRALLVLATLVFFWTARSFASYLLDLLPAALVGAATVRAEPRAASLGRLRRGALVAAAFASAAFVGCVAVAVATPQPLRLDVVGIRSTGQQQTVRELTVRVTNTTGRGVRPTFSVMSGQYLTRPWLPVGGPVSVPPNGTAVVRLRAPNKQAMPSLQGGWVLAAFTPHPRTVSTSAVEPPTREFLSLQPMDLSRPIEIGEPVELRAELRNRFGSPVRRAGVHVLLGQAVYTEHGILAGETSIDGRPVGQSPVGARTDARGVAHFTVRGVTAQSAPVFFQAWIAPDEGVPRGYSDQLAIQFVEPGARHQ